MVLTKNKKPSKKVKRKPTKKKIHVEQTKPKKPKKPKKPANNNLNQRFDAEIQAQRKQGVVVQNVSSVELIFDGIEKRLIHELNKPNVNYALVISPWCSNQSILKALASLSGAAILTYRDKHTKSAIRMKLFQAITPLKSGMDRVRCLQCGSGRQKSIIHQKMLVFLDGDRKPVSSAWGSWNASGGSESNIEMFSLSNDQRVAEACRDEFCRIYGISRRLCQ